MRLLWSLRVVEGCLEGGRRENEGAAQRERGRRGCCALVFVVGIEFVCVGKDVGLCEVFACHVSVSVCDFKERKNERQCRKRAYGGE